MKRISLYASLSFLPVFASEVMAISRPAPGSAAQAEAPATAGIPAIYMWMAVVLVIALGVGVWRNRSGGKR